MPYIWHSSELIMSSNSEEYITQNSCKERLITGALSNVQGLLSSIAEVAERAPSTNEAPGSIPGRCSDPPGQTPAEYVRCALNALAGKVTKRAKVKGSNPCVAN